MIASLVVWALFSASEISLASRRSLTWSNAREQIHLVTIESIELSLVDGAAERTLRQSRRTIENIVDGVHVPVTAGNEPEIQNWVLGGKRTPEAEDQVSARVDRVIRAVLELHEKATGSTDFEGRAGKIPSGRVTFRRRTSLLDFDVAYTDRETSEALSLRGTVTLDPKTGLVSGLRLTAQDVPLPHSLYSADLVIEQPPRD